MNKIPTLFKRDMTNGGKIITEVDSHVPEGFFNTNPVATEKLDGTNVRLTVRNHILIRLEKRRNPTAREKYLGIKDPWYVDAYENDPSDKYIWEAAKNTDLTNVSDGEWSGEALGPKIQGNSLNLGTHRVVLFSLGQAPIPPTPDWEKRWEQVTDNKYHEEDSILVGSDGYAMQYPESMYELDKEKTKQFIRQTLTSDRQKLVAEVEKMKKEVSPEDEYAADYGTGKLYGWNNALEAFLALIKGEKV